MKMLAVDLAFLLVVPLQQKVLESPQPVRREFSILSEQLCSGYQA
jgi:hypothetical protein